MIITISSRGKDLDSPIEPRFGRCAFFIIYNTPDESFEVFDNESTGMGVCGNRRMGRGMGRGLGMGNTMSINSDIQRKGIFSQNPRTNLSKSQELSRLKEQSRALQKQMNEIRAQIEKLEEKA